MSNLPSVDTAGTSVGELTELSLPTTSPAAAENAERQFDRLVNMLAAEQAATELGTMDGTSTTPIGKRDPSDVLELSIVMPCLDEADTVGNCVLKALYTLERAGISGEVIVADRGSRDDSIEIAELLGAHVLHVDGAADYETALKAGLEAARGKYVVIGTADDSYDFSQAHQFYHKLRNGADLVHGCRLPSGGGRIKPGAMSRFRQLRHRLLNRLLKAIVKVPCHDVFCRVQGLTKAFFLDASESLDDGYTPTRVLANGVRQKKRIEEIGITLHANGSSHSPSARQRVSLGQRCRACLAFFS